MISAMVLYAPVLHRGYLEFLERHCMQVPELYLFGDELIEELRDSGYREIREVQPRTMAEALHATGLAPSRPRILLPKRAQEWSPGTDVHLVMPTLEICRRFAAAYVPEARISWDTVFLQWDSASVLSQQVVTSNYQVSHTELDRGFMKLGLYEAGRSSDWWRHVGAVLIKGDEVLFQAHNRHGPDEQAQYVIGDPRDFVEAGTDSHIATALHVEQEIITWAAREGVSLKDCDLYIPVFPCPMCAKQLAYSGIRRIYFASGHASLDGESILRSQGVELIFVEM